jgi:transketolase
MQRQGLLRRLSAWSARHLLDAIGTMAKIDFNTGRTSDFERARQLAAQLRVDSLRSSTEAGSGHPTSSLSAADLMAVLLSDFLRWAPGQLDHPNNDHLVFSKGHASPLLYAMLKAVGVISNDELLSYRRLGSRLQGHPVPPLPGVDVATGSLGQGLPIAVGIALAAKYLEHLPYRIWVLLGDSEMSEGSIWEAFDHARHYRLGNIVAILDMNRLGQRGETPLGWSSAVYAARARAFGWRAIEIDGHDPAAISGAYAEALDNCEEPTLIVAQTIKGKGVPAIEDKNGWHGKALDPAMCAEAIEALGGERDLVIRPRRPEAGEPTPLPSPGPSKLPSYGRTKPVATRKAYGDALEALGGARPDIVVLDGEVSNSTFADAFGRAYPDRYFEMFISEQQMVAAGVGLSVRGKCAFVSTFAAFLTRAFDFIRMAAVSNAGLRLCGSHAGVSIGQDGPSQMGLEDMAMMRAVHGSTVLYPCCANQTAKLVALMADGDPKSIFYLRTTREATAVLYPSTEEFAVGGSKVLRQSDVDRVTVIAAGITVHEALVAADRLERSGISARIIDAYSVKPLDEAAIRSAVRTTGNAIVVEDHWAEGGLGDAVASCLSGADPITAHVVRLAVHEMPGSGTPEELLHAAGIDAAAIVAAAERLVAIARRCYVCGKRASWRIAVGGEDEVPTQEDACELHAHAHLHIARLGDDVQPIQRLRELGQSVWLDFLDEKLLKSGELERMIEHDGVTGITSNPTIFQKAIAGSSDYDAFIRSSSPIDSDASVFEAIQVRTVMRACDQLRPIYDQTDGGDGFASVEVSPTLARDTAGSIAEARRLWSLIARPNLMVKIPGTREGLPAIRQCLTEGININITLLFSVERYLAVAEAYLLALEARLARREPFDCIASVASFFVSRVDTKVDKALDALGTPTARAERGHAAIANAKIAYEQYERLLASDRWRHLANRGAKPQRLLWASTSPKDPAYPDLHYAEALVGPGTIDTMTKETRKAYADHGTPDLRLTRGRAEARTRLASLAALGIDLPKVTEELEDEGIRAFVDSYEKALAAISEKRSILRGPPAGRRQPLRPHGRTPR